MHIAAMAIPAICSLRIFGMDFAPLVRGEDPMTESLGFVMCAAVAAGAIVGCAHGNITAPKSLTFHRLVGITAEDIERSPGTPVEQLLAPRVPGLFLTPARDGHVVVDGPAQIGRAACRGRG